MSRKTRSLPALTVALLAALATLATLFTACQSPQTTTAATATPPAATTTTSATAAPTTKPHPVILISIDGMRHDYLDLYKPPALTALARRGSRARRLVSSYPSLTFPNHYTIVTGLRPGHHGIIANSMYDPEWKANFGIGAHPAAREARWWGGEPVWNTAERQGLIAACNFWPGSEAPINNRRPAIWLPFKDGLPLPPRVVQVLSWLDLPDEKRPSLITFYFSDVDHAGHTHGPVSPQVRDELMKVDAAIGQLVDGLRARNLLDSVNIVVVSDHGMTATSSERLVIIEDCLPGGTLEGIAQLDTAGTHAALRPLGDTTPAQLRDYFRGKNPHMTAYLKEELPARFHYTGNRRIPPVILVPETGWLITTRARTGPNARPTPLGSHGFDPNVPDMGATFIAAGPSFKKAHVFARADNTDIYNMLCALLKIHPAPNDGGNALARKVLLRKQ
ncbi:MAG: ectonucleotide pyrophosphatase/phosphodiesterase [Opitutaceae bacterium]|jgi:predicted AlkP superfamily pyrophosphatase or phosphodiesterase|nr:ectonucleotide pyrophosphatase/phosphodiesterase [Opitutaceae bacterium]